LGDAGSRLTESREWVFGATVVLLIAPQVKPEAIVGAPLSVKHCVLFFCETVRKHCEARACVVIKLVLRAAA
jgi:hypothetical protein